MMEDWKPRRQRAKMIISPVRAVDSEHVRDVHDACDTRNGRL